MLFVYNVDCSVLSSVLFCLFVLRVRFNNNNNDRLQLWKKFAHSLSVLRPFSRWTWVSRCSLTVHYLQWRMPPFHASVLRPVSQVGPMHEATGVGKLVNAALLSLINEACCATLLSIELVGPACVQVRSSNPRGRACRPSGKRRGRRGYWVALYLYIYTARLLVSVFL